MKLKKTIKITPCMTCDYMFDIDDCKSCKEYNRIMEEWRKKMRHFPFLRNKEEKIIKALKSVDSNIECSNDWESVISIQIQSLIKYIKENNEEDYQIAIDWHKAWKVYDK